MEIALGIIALAIAAPFIRKYIIKRQRAKSEGYTIPGDVITRDMKDPYSQTIWEVFDSGKSAMYSAGDDYMTVTDKDGKSEKKKLEKD